MGRISGKLTGTQKLWFYLIFFLGRGWVPSFPRRGRSAFSPLAGRACRAAAQTGCLQSIVREKGSHKDWEQKKEEQHTRNKEKEAEQEQAQTQAEQILCIEQSPPAHYVLSINPPLINQTPLSRAKQRR